MFYKFARFLLGSIFRILFRIRVEGDNILKDSDGCIIFSNHICLFDPIVVGCFTRRQIRFMAKEELFRNSFFGNVLIRLGAFPVKRGKVDISAIKNAIRLLKNGEVLGMFPEGTRSRTGELLEAEPGLSMIAVRAKVPVVPVAISTDYKLFRPVTVKIGAPVNLEDYYNKKLTMKEHKGLSNKLMGKVQDMLEGLN